MQKFELTEICFRNKTKHIMIKVHSERVHRLDLLKTYILSTKISSVSTILYFWDFWMVTAKKRKIFQ